MELTPQEKSRHWWKGTLIGAVKGLTIGLAVGAASALLLSMVLPSFPALQNVFQSFLTMGGEFSVIPLAVFSGVSGLISGVFTGGSSGITAYHQDRHNRMQMHQDQKLNELGGKVQKLEQAMPVNRTVQTILSKGNAKDQRFAETELENREDATSTDRTIH